MPKPKIAKSKRPEAERACEHYLREVCGCVNTRRAVQTQWQKVDFFSCDVMGIRPDGTRVWAQATAGGNEALRVRRRKLEAEVWHPSDTVLVLQLTSTEDPARRSRKLWWFRVHRLWTADGDDKSSSRCAWTLDADAETVPREWLKAWKPD